MEPKKEQSRARALLISLGVTLGMLALVMGMAYWYQSATGMQLDPKGMWTGNAIGGVIMFLIVYHFVRKPKE